MKPAYNFNTQARRSLGNYISPFFCAEMDKKITKMKKLMFIVLLAGLSFSAYCQSEKKEKADTKKELKEHVCTKDCAPGKHVYAHGKKGDDCTEACKKEMKKEKTKLKKHVFNDACTDGKHVYAHGEKGHVCTEACKKSEQM